MSEELNYEDDMYIDETALDVEWLNQPALAKKYGENSKLKRKLATLAEEKIKLIRSKLINNVNANPTKCLGKDVKINDKNIEAYYRTHSNYLKAKKRWVEAVYEADIAEVAYKEISFARKSALEYLVKLHGQLYFAGPSVPHDLEELRELHTKEADKKIAKHLTRKKDD